MTRINHLESYVMNGAENIVLSGREVERVWLDGGSPAGPEGDASEVQ